VTGGAAGLLDPLGVGRGDVVAVAGAGGKTTLVYQLAAEAHALGLRVLVTTTTHMGGLAGADIGPVLVEADDPEPRGRALADALAREGRATLLGRRVREDKLEGIPPERVDALRSVADLVVVEADGARGRSLKVPAAHEPVVPASTTLLVVVAALDVVGKPLTADWVHRLDLVLAATGRAPGDLVDEAVVARALADPGGYLARRPRGARFAVFLNKAEDDAAFERARGIAHGLGSGVGRVVAGSARQGTGRIVDDTVVH
jgi:probable selenium-dependent hydroxylase accessory protein YqeC